MTRAVAKCYGPVSAGRSSRTSRTASSTIFSISPWGMWGIGGVNFTDDLFEEIQSAAAVGSFGTVVRHTADTRSVFLKSSPLKRRGSPVNLASA
jgi:hypothetical protein